LKTDDVDKVELNEIRRDNVKILKKLKLSSKQVDELEKSIYKFSNSKNDRDRIIMPTWDNMEFMNVYRNKPLVCILNLNGTTLC